MFFKSITKSNWKVETKILYKLSENKGTKNKKVIVPKKRITIPPNSCDFGTLPFFLVSSIFLGVGSWVLFS